MQWKLLPQFYLLVVLLAALGASFLMQASLVGQVPTVTAGSQSPPHSDATNPPPPTSADTVQAEASEPFQFVITYTDTGFEPRVSRIPAGKTVRFTNSSTGPLWVAADSAAGHLYPAAMDECGSSALDSCQALSPERYWQFTFTQKGTWAFHNSLNEVMVGTVIVQ